jgi:hypothetical protein
MLASVVCLIQGGSQADDPIMMGCVVLLLLSTLLLQPHSPCAGAFCERDLPAAPVCCQAGGLEREVLLLMARLDAICTPESESRR